MPDAHPYPAVAVISHMYPQRSREGYGQFVAEQVRALDDLGVPVVSVIVPSPWAPWPLPRLSAKWRSYAEAERHRLDGTVAVSLPRYVSLPRKLARGLSARTALRSIEGDSGLSASLRQAKVIVAHTALLDGRIARALSETLEVPFAVVIHGEDLYQNVLGDSRGRLRAAVGEVLEAADVVIGVSHPLANDLTEAFPALAEKGVRVLPNGVDTELFSPSATPAGPAEQPEPDSDEALGSAERPLRVLSAGHLVKRKAHAYLLQALAELRERGVVAELTIAGDGPERASLEALAAELGLGGVVRFTGTYRHDALPDLLRAADLFALPSWDEAFGVVYLEAMATGVPALAGSDAGARDIVEAGVDGYLVVPRDARAIADAIAGFVALSPEARASMRSAAREKALGFTWEANARTLAGILAEVAR